jgi:prevent-host-death family protein
MQDVFAAIMLWRMIMFAHRRAHVALLLELRLHCRYVATLSTKFMAHVRFSSREFNQDTSRAKRAAKRGPVFITDRGRPSHVLLSVEDYQKLTDKQRNIVDLLGMPEAAEVEFEPPRMKGDLHQTADLS